MLVLILVSPDRARPYADLEVARSLLDQGHRRAANVLRIVPLGRDCDQGVSASEHNAPLDSADFIPSGGPLIKGKVEITSTYMNTTYSVLTGLNAVVGLFSSLAVNMPDFGRFSKNQLAGYHQFLALPIIGTLGALTPIFVTDAHSYIWGDFEWYMPDVIAKFDSRAAKFFVSASFLLATIGNQIAADTYPFANDVAGMLPKYINIFRATIIISVFCIVSTPWNIIKNASGLLSFLSGYSCLMGPLAGTMVSDYYLVKKGKLDVDQLYTDRGIYWYNRGWNWRACVIRCGICSPSPWLCEEYRQYSRYRWRMESIHIRVDLWVLPFASNALHNLRVYFASNRVVGRKCGVSAAKRGDCANPGR